MTSKTWPIIIADASNANKARHGNIIRFPESFSVRGGLRELADLRSPHASLENRSNETAGEK